MAVLRIAGTSAEGYYARRIMNILNKEKSLSVPIDIIISRGKHQSAVVKVVENDIDCIERLLSIGSAVPIMLNCELIKEKKMSLSDKQFVFMQDLAHLTLFCVKHNIKITGGELLRSMYQQKEHVRKGRSKTMNSDHLRKLAIDLAFFFNGKLSYSKKDIQPVADYWKSLRPTNYWGGDWTNPVDTPHFGTK